MGTNPEDLIGRVAAELRQLCSDMEERLQGLHDRISGVEKGVLAHRDALTKELHDISDAMHGAEQRILGRVRTLIHGQPQVETPPSDEPPTAS